MQSRLWGLAKEAMGYSPKAFRIHWNAHKDSMVLFIRPGREGFSLAYVPWAPTFFVPEEERGLLLEELSNALMGHLPDDCVFIRYDLPWESPYSLEKNLPSDRIREVRMNFGTGDKNLRKAPIDIQPVDTRILDLSMDPEELLAEMRPKTRYNIRLARRRGIKVKDASFERLPEWYRMYLETTRRNGIFQHGYEGFKLLLQTKRKNSLPNSDVRLLLAEEEGVPLAGMILVLHGRTATYLYGASSSRKRNLMPTYRLQWEAIQLAKQADCSYYDMFGIPPDDTQSHPMHGLYRFKVGFGGYTFHRQGCWDYPIKKELYREYAGEEPTKPGYHLR